MLVDQWLATLGGAPARRVTIGRDDDRARLVARLATASSDERSAALVVDAARARPDPGLDDDLHLILSELPRTVPVIVEQRGPWRSGVDRANPVVVGPAELAFTAEEAHEHVAAVSGRSLTDTQLGELMARTQGWPLAVTLAARALRGPNDARSVLRAISGAERRVAAFLNDEVLERHELSVRTFLLHTSVLDVLTPEACVAVTGEPDASDTLAVLAATGAVLLPTGDGPAGAVHPPLLRRLLHDELYLAEPAEAQALEARAAAFWAESGDLTRAADQCIGAELWPTLLDLADRHGPSLFERGEARELLRWLDAVPASSSEQRKQVGLRRALVLNMLGETRRAEAILTDLGELPLSQEDRLLVAAIRATWVFHDADRSAMVVAVVDEALPVLEASDPAAIPNILGLTDRPSMAAMLRGSRGRARWYARDVAGARDDLTAIALDEDAYPPWRIHSHGTLGLIEAWAGNLAVARRLAAGGRALAEAHGLQQHPSTLEVRATEAHLLREEGDLERSSDVLDELLEIALRLRRPTSLVIHAIERGLWHLAAGRPDLGLATLAAERALGEVRPPEVILRRRQAVEIRLLLAEGDVAAARRLLDRAAPDAAPPEELRSSAALCAVVDGDHAGARLLLEVPVAAPDPGLRSRLELGLLAAVIDLRDGERRTAVERAREVVRDGEGAGIRRTFLDLGPPIEPVLRAVLRAERSPYVAALLGSATEPGGRRSAAAGLSDREVDVVRYLPTSLTNAEIAAQLYISLNTLKSHLASIYRKLEVADRRGAIARAQELGLA